MSVLLKDWNNILETLVQGKLDSHYINDRIYPLLISTDLGHYIDNLGESLLFYSITYQNELLLKKLLETVQYSSIPAKNRKKLKKSVFRGIKQLCYNAECLPFIEEAIKCIANSTFSPFITDFVKQGNFEYIFENVLPREKTGFDLMHSIIYIVKEHALLPDEDEAYTNLRKSFRTAGNLSLWNRFAVKNFIENASFTLNHIEYEFFHYAVQKGLYNQIETFNLIQLPNFLLKKNSAGESVFLLIFKLAPFEFLYRNIQHIGKTLKKSDNEHSQINNRSQTFLHLLILNKKMNLKEKQQILKALDDPFRVNEYCKIADNNNQTALTLFINKFAKELEKNYIEFIDIIDLLTPKVTLPLGSESLRRICGYVILQRLGLKVEKSEQEYYERTNKQDLIYNQNVIRTCLDLGLESLLIELLNRIPYLNLDSYYSEAVGTTRHLICIAAEKNRTTILKWFLNNYAGKEHSLLSLDSDEAFKTIWNRNAEEGLIDQETSKRSINYSILDEIVDFLGSIWSETAGEKSLDLLIEITDKIRQRIPEKEMNDFLLSTSWKSKDRMQMSLVKVLLLENKKILSLFEDSIQKLAESNLLNTIRKNLLFSTLKAKNILYLKSPMFKKEIKLSQDKVDDELLYLSELLFKVPETFSFVTSICPELKPFLFGNKFLTKLTVTKFNKPEERALVKELGALALDFLLRQDLHEGPPEVKEAAAALIRGVSKVRVLLRLSKQVIRNIVRSRKLREIYSKLCEIEDRLDIGVFLNKCRLSYIQDAEDDLEFEEVFTEAENSIKEKYGGNLKSIFKSVVFKYTNLKELEKAGRLKYKGWKIELISPHLVLQQIKKQNVQSPEILYLPLFSNFSDPYITSYALELCKSGKEIDTIRNIYNDKMPNFSLKFSYNIIKENYLKPEAILLDYAIRTLDVQGVESVIDQIYDKDHIQDFHSPIYAIYGCIKRAGKDIDKTDIESINKIVHKIFVTYSEEVLEKFFLPKLVNHNSRQVDFLGQRGLNKYLDNTNFRLSQQYSRMYTYIPSLLKRDIQLIKEVFTGLLEYADLDSIILSNLTLLINKEKISFAFEIFKLRPDLISKSNYLISKCTEFCMQHKKELLKKFVNLLFKKRILLKDRDILNKMKINDKANYYILTFSNYLRADEYYGKQVSSEDVQRALIQLNIDKLMKIIDKFKKSRPGDLANLFENEVFVRVLAINGLSKKIQKLMALATELKSIVSEEALLKWNIAAFESSCEIKELINAGKITGLSQNNHFNSNLFSLKHALALDKEPKNLDKDGKILKKHSCDPVLFAFHYRFLSYESDKGKQYDLGVKDWGVKVSPFAERKIKIQLKERYAKTDPQVKLKERNAEGEEVPIIKPKVEKRYNIYGYEPKCDAKSDVKDAKRHRKVEVLEQKKLHYNLQEQFAKRYANPIYASAVFQPYRQDWSLYNKKDDRDIDQTIAEAFNFIKESERLKESSKSEDEDENEAGEPLKKWEDILMIGVRSDLIMIKEELFKYFDKLIQTDTIQYLTFYFKVLITLIQRRNALIRIERVSRNRVHSSSKQETEAILQLIAHFKGIQNKNQKDLLLMKIIFIDFLRELFFYNDLDLSQAFLLCLFETFPVDDPEKIFGIPPSVVISIFLGATISKKSFTHFKALISLHPSINVIFNIKALNKFTEGSSGTQNKMILSQQRTPLLKLVFQNKLWDFILEYDRLKGGELLLQPIETSEMYRSRAKFAFNRMANPLWLHMAIADGSTEIAEAYSNKVSYTEDELECALHSGNYKCFKFLLNKLYEGDSIKIFNFIKSRNVLLSIFQMNFPESFIISLLKEYVSNSSLTRSNCVLSVEDFKNTDEHGCTIFHFIVFHRRPNLLYTILRYIKEISCRDNQETFISAMNSLLNQPVIKQNAEGESQNDAEILKELPSPLELAYFGRFYELTCLAKENDITLEKEPDKSKYTMLSRFRHSLSNKLSDQAIFDNTYKKLTAEKDNEFTTFYNKTVRAFLQTVQLLQKSCHGLPRDWIGYVENLYFFNVVNQIEDDLVTDGLKAKIFEKSGTDFLLIRLYPRVIPTLLSEPHIYKLSPIAMVYLLDGISKSQQSVQTQTNIWKEYISVLSNPNPKASQSINSFEKAWIDPNLTKSIEEIRQTLRSETSQMEAFNAFGSSSLPQQVIQELASKYYTQGSTFIVKALILTYPSYFFALKEESSEESPAGIWNYFVNTPSFMCSVLSQLDQQSFESAIINSMDKILSTLKDLKSANSNDPNIKLMCWCLFYTACSLRAEKQSNLLSKQQLVSFLNDLMSDLTSDEPPTTDDSRYFVNSFLTCVTQEEFVYTKLQNIDNYKTVFEELYKGLRVTFFQRKTWTKDPNPQQRSNDMIERVLEIEEEEIDRHLSACLEFILKSLKEERNPLIVFSNVILAGLDLLKITEEVLDLSRKFNIDVQLTFVQSFSDEKSLGVQVQKISADQLGVVIGYSVQYIKEQRRFMLIWENKPRSEVEYEIERLYITEKLKKEFANGLQPKQDINIAIPEIDFESLESLPYNEQTRIFHSDSYLSYSYDTYFGILPFWKEVEIALKNESQAHLPLINDAEEGYPPLQLQASRREHIGEKRFICHEFYSLFFPKIGQVNVKFAKSEIFESKRNKALSLDNLIKSLNFYQNQVLDFSKKEEQELTETKQDTIEILAGGIVPSNHFEAPYYNVLRIRRIIKNFREKKVHSFSREDLLMFRWELDTMSFLKEIVSNIVNTLKDAMTSSSQASKKDKNRKGMGLSREGEEDIYTIIENYFDHSILRKLLSVIVHTFIVDTPEIIRSYHGFYVTFEKAQAGKSSNLIDSEHLHLLDRIIHYDHVELEVVGKMVLIKLQYSVNKLSATDLESYVKVKSSYKDVLATPHSVQNYLDGFFSKFDVLYQLLAPSAVIDTLLNKKAVDEYLMNFSKTISDKAKKKITFAIGYRKLYRLIEPLIKQATLPGTSRTEFISIFAQIEHKLETVKKFIETNLSEKVDNTFFSDDYMDLLATKVQIQNYLYSRNKKKPLAEFLNEKSFGFKLYPAKSDKDAKIITKPKTYTKPHQFEFLIQTDKRLTLSNAIPGQEYLIFTKTEVKHFKVQSDEPLPFHADGYYLLMSPVWPNLDFCSKKVDRVLVLDAKETIIDINYSALKELIENIQSDDLVTFEKIRPYLVNPEFTQDSDITVQNLFALYPSLVTLQLTSLETQVKKKSSDADIELPSLRSMRSSMGSQIFDEQKVFDLFFTEDDKVDMMPFRSEELRYSQRLRTNLEFQSVIRNFRYQTKKLLKSFGVMKNRVNVVLPKISFEFDENLDWNMKMKLKDFNDQLRLIFYDIEGVLKNLFSSMIMEGQAVQETYKLLYKKDIPANEILSMRKIASFCESISDLRLFITDHENNTISFDPDRKELRIQIQISHTSNHWNFYYPQKDEIIIFISKLLMEDELKRTQNVITSKDNATETGKLIKNVISNMERTLAPTVNVSFKLPELELNSQFQEIFSALLLLDMSLWNLAIGTLITTLKKDNTLKKLEKINIYIYYDDSKRLSNSVKTTLNENHTTLDLTLNLSDYSRTIILDYKTVYLSLCKQVIGTESYQEQSWAPHVKPLESLECNFSENQVQEKKFEVDTGCLQELLNNNNNQDEPMSSIDIYIEPKLLGLNDLALYPCPNSELSEIEGIAKSEKMTLRIILRNNLPVQNYLVCFVINNHVLVQPQIINVTQSETKKAEPVSEVKPALSLENSRVVRPENPNKDKKPKQEDDEDPKALYFKKPTTAMYNSIYSNLETSAQRRRYDINTEDQSFITKKDLESPEIKVFMDTNFITALQDEDYFSLAGDERVDILQLRDKYNQECPVSKEEVIGLPVMFMHNRSVNVKCKGVIFEKEEGKFVVKWTPLIKGSYSMFINGIAIKGANNLTVLANKTYKETSIFRWPNLEKYAFYDAIKFETEFRDVYGNRLNQVEIEKQNMTKKPLEVKVTGAEVSSNLTFENVNRNGIQRGELTILPQVKDQNEVQEMEIMISFLLNEEPLYEKTVKVLGFGFTKRLNLFYSSIKKHCGSYGNSIVVTRATFLKDLLNYSPEKFKSIGNVNFVHEPGIDAGGLKREFWELAGKEIKNNKNKIFAELDDKYFLSYDLVLNEKTKKSLELFGALIAGAIANQQLLGVNFTNMFEKAFLGSDAELEDLKHVFGEQVTSNYKILLELEQEELDDLELYFTVSIGKTQYDLVPHGAEVKVTKENVADYLKAIVQFYSNTFHKEALDLLHAGFNKVFPLTELKRWFVHYELSLLTYGTLNVTAENIAKFIKYSGGNATLEQFFMQFLKESDTTMLRNFLKFTTGSSSLPYDSAHYSLLVSFENRDVSNLPISHTCSKHLEVPKYKSYEKMKKMLTIAFTYASEGFGFG